MNNQNREAAQAAEGTRKALYGSDSFAGAQNGSSAGTQEYQTYTPASSQVPQELNKWNWGAFVFNIWWGIGNKTYLPLLCLIPLFNIVWIFICGAMGNKWLWESGRFTDIEDFKKRQESWNRAGFVGFWVYIAVLVICIIASVSIVHWISAFYYNYGSPYNNYYNY